MPTPRDYGNLKANSDIIEGCKTVKQELDLTWNEFLLGCTKFGLLSIEREELESIAEQFDMDNIEDTDSKTIVQGILDSIKPEEYDG